MQDAFEVAKERSGSYTVPPEIDGWKGNTEPLRIDVFTKELEVESLHGFLMVRIVHKSATTMVLNAIKLEQQKKMKGERFLSFFTKITILEKKVLKCLYIMRKYPVKIIF